MSELLLSEHHETVDPKTFTCDVKIDRGEVVSSWPENKGKYKRFAFTESGISPRALPGTANTLYVSPSDDHDEESILISDMFTAPPIRKKIMEKRMRKVERLLKELPAPQLEGPKDAELTLVTWGSTAGVVKEAAEQLTASGVKTNMLCIKYIYPFHAKEVKEILGKAKKKISVELNFTSQMARYICSETGIVMDGYVNKYDGEPYAPLDILTEVKTILAARSRSLDVTEAEAREIAYHYLRTHSAEKLRPSKIVQEAVNGFGEPTWYIELIERTSSAKKGFLKVGLRTGATYTVQMDQ
jgi:2-oxoglutarate/2-oxoacid ferredoxin oxidoreductase subunit alpha